MTLIAMFSDKGSPGVTTSALALATVWPRRVAVVELDPAGGDLGLRLTDHAERPTLADQPNLLTLAAAARREGAPHASLVWTHAQPLPASPDASVVTGLSAPEQAAGMGELWPHIADALAAADGGDVIADLGRIGHGGPTQPVLEGAGVLVGVVRAEPVAMLRMRDRMRHVLGSIPRADGRRAFVVLVAEDRRAGEAVAAMTRVFSDGAVSAQVAGAIVVDCAGVDALHRSQPGPRLDRSVLLRSARSVASAICGEPLGSVPQPRRGLLARSR
ncbi:MAG: hypothetical protein ACT4QG_22115 [Sporichthyaceae bacterium]